MADHLLQMLLFFGKTLPECGTFASSLNAEQRDNLRAVERGLASEQTDAEIVRLVKRLMWSLITTEYPVDQIDQFKDPTIQYLIAKSLMRDGGLKACNVITSEVAAIQYNWRFFFFLECLDKAAEEEKHMFE